MHRPRERDTTWKRHLDARLDSHLNPALRRGPQRGILAKLAGMSAALQPGEVARRAHGPLPRQAAGVLSGQSKTSDVIDASVALLARRHAAAVLTSDPEDLKRIDPKLPLVAC